MFDGARTFHSFAAFAVAGSLLTIGVGGGWSLLGVIIGLYYFRKITSGMDARIHSERRRPPGRRRLRRR